MADGDAHEQILTAGAIIPAEGPRFDGQGESMARRRYQKGRVILRGKVNSVWVGRWREDVIGADGVTRRIEPSEFSAASPTLSRPIPSPRFKTSRAQRIYTYIKDASRSMTPALATRIDEMPHLDRLRFKTTYVFLQLAVPSRQSLVLSQVLRP